MTSETKSNGTAKQSRFSLTIINENDIRIIEEFKDICKKQKKRYTNVTLNLLREYIDDYKATR